MFVILTSVDVTFSIWQR